MIIINNRASVVALVLSNLATIIITLRIEDIVRIAEIISGI